MTNKITYTQQGDYLLPDLKLPEQPKVEIGIWGKRHLKYIKHYRPILYTNLLTSCKLTAYLADIDEQADDMFFRLVEQLAEKESNAVGTKNEYYLQSGNRDSKQRFDICINRTDEGGLFHLRPIAFYYFLSSSNCEISVKTE